MSTARRVAISAALAPDATPTPYWCCPTATALFSCSALATPCNADRHKTDDSSRGWMPLFLGLVISSHDFNAWRTSAGTRLVAMAARTLSSSPLATWSATASIQAHFVKPPAAARASAGASPWIAL